MYVPITYFAAIIELIQCPMASKDFTIPRFVFIQLVCTFFIDIPNNKIDLEGFLSIPSIAQHDSAFAALLKIPSILIIFSNVQHSYHYSVFLTLQWIQPFLAA